MRCAHVVVSKIIITDSFLYIWKYTIFFVIIFDHEQKNLHVWCDILVIKHYRFTDINHLIENLVDEKKKLFIAYRFLFHIP